MNDAPPLPAGPYVPRAYLLKHQVAKMLRLTGNKFTRRRAALEALGFPKPVTWVRHPEQWDPLAIALWQNAQMSEAHQAELARILRAESGEAEPAPFDVDAAVKRAMADTPA